MAQDKENWREALGRSAEMWNADKGSEALKILDEALVADPGHPLLKMQKYYMEKADEYRGEVPKIQFPPRRDGDPTVSVIMTTYNRSAMLKESVASVVAQTFKDWELILVNDGGSKDAEQIAKSFNDDRIKYFHIEHAGRSPALNACLTNSRGKYIGILDDDDIYYPDHLERLTRFFDEHAEAVVVYSEAIMAKQKLEENNIYKIIEKKNSRVFDFDIKILQQRTLFPTNAALIRRDAIEKAGGFNESLLAGVDWDMWIRLSNEGVFYKMDGAGCEFRWREDGSNITTSALHKRAHFHNAIGFTHKGIMFDGESLKGRQGEKAINALRFLFDSDPGFIDFVEAHKLMESPKPYGYFLSLSNIFSRTNDTKRARLLLKAAIKAAPHEIKLWLEYIKNVIF